MKHVLLMVVFCISGISLAAQPNLVPNGNFETYTSCPSGLSQTANCTGWGPYTNGTSDYFNTCHTGTSVSVPSNTFGFQQPASGNGYVGGYNNVTATNAYKEYVTRSITPLQPGYTYEVSMSVSLANTLGGIAVDDISVYFFDAAPAFVNTTQRVNVVAQVDYSGSGAFSDTANWMRLTKTFVADSAYDNIVIGGFKDPAFVVKDTVGSSTNSYYYYDSIVIKLYDSLGFTFNDSTLCSGDTISIPYYVARKKQSTNVFTLQLSNSSGSFASPVNIGSRNSDTSGTITAVIPASTATGTGYRFRILTSNHPDTSYTSIALKIGNGPLAKPVANNNGPVCANDTLKLTASSTSSGVTYRWTGPNSFISTTQNPSIISPLPVNSGNYIVTTTLHGCEAKDTTTAVVNAGSGPSGTTATSNAPMCVDDTLKLFGTANGSGNSYSWTGPNSFTSNQQNPVFAAATSSLSGDYVLYASNGNCISRDTVTVLVKPRPANFSGTSNSPLCTGETINFTGSSTSSGVTYAWTGPNGFNSTSATPFIGGSSGVHSGDYYVTGTLNGCSLKDTATVLVKPLPVKPTANSNTPICAGSTLNLNATTSTGGVTWSWAGPNSFATTTQNPNITNTTTGMSGDYIVTVTLNGCIAKDTATVLVKPLPAPVTASSNTPVCAGDSLLISIGTSTTGVTYSWTGPNSFTANTQNTFVANSTVAATGWYIATLNLNGCLFKDSTQATVYPIPATPTLSYNNPLCTGETLSLNASTVSGATYSWIGVNGFTANVQNPIRSNMQFGDTGTYTVTATANGCTSPAGNISVRINPLPFVVIFATPGDTICAGAMAAFTALPNNHGGVPVYQWYKNSIAVGTGGSVYSSTTLNDKDIIRCDMRENTKCSAPYTDQSNDIEMNVLPWLAPTVTISANPNKPLNVDEYVTFTATFTNAGLSPKFQWKRNGANVQGATGAVWSANTLNDNDSISVEIISAYKCPLPPTAMSNGIRVKVLTGVGEVTKANGLMLYPNPNNGSFTLKGNLLTNSQVTISVVNALGQVMHKELIQPDNFRVNHKIDMKIVAAGVYILKIEAEGSKDIIRFFVR